MKVKDLIKQLQQLNQHARVDVYIPCYVGEDSSFDYETSNFEIHTGNSSPDEDNPYIEIYCLNSIADKYQAITSDNADYFVQGEEDAS